MESIKLKNGFLVNDKGFRRSDLVLCDSRIDLSGREIVCEKTMDLAGRYIVPGFVDIHTHGYESFDFTFGLFDPKAKAYDNSEATYEQCLDKLRRKLAEFGVTGFYIGSVMAPIETFKRCYSRLHEYLRGAGETEVGARLLGGLLEAPFISPEKTGAMTPELVLEPTIEAFESIENGGTIKLVNVVPDSGEKSCKLTKYLTDKGIIVGAGHTAATCNQMAEAIKAGLKYCIHFTNQTEGLYKPFEGGGALEAVLKFDELYAELIADGYHVNPAYIRDIIKRKGLERIIGITDCMFVAGSDLKRINVAGTAGRLSEDGKYIAVEGKKNTLFGSNLTINRAFENMLNWLSSDMEGMWNRRHSALSFEQALSATARIYSTNACELTGRKKEGFGSIFDGARADLTVLDISGEPGNYKLQIEATIVDGRIVYSKN